MDLGVARTDDPEVAEIVPSDHCLHRFRARAPWREAGVEAAATGLIDSLEAAHVVRWPPAWALSERGAERWAVEGDLAYPLAPTGLPGRWLAITCLRRTEAGGRSPR